MPHHRPKRGVPIKMSSTVSVQDVMDQIDVAGAMLALKKYRGRRRRSRSRSRSHSFSSKKKSRRTKRSRRSRR